MIKAFYITLIKVLILALSSGNCFGQIIIDKNIVKAISDESLKIDSNYFITNENCNCYFNTKENRFEIAWGFWDGLSGDSFNLNFTRKNSDLVYSTYSDLTTEKDSSIYHYPVKNFSVKFSSNPYRSKHFWIKYNLEKPFEGISYAATGYIHCKDISSIRHKGSLTQKEYQSLLDTYINSNEHKKFLKDNQVKKPVSYLLKHVNADLKYINPRLNIIDKFPKDSLSGTVVSIGITHEDNIKPYTLKLVITAYNAKKKPIYYMFASYILFKKDKWIMTKSNEFYVLK